MLIHVVQRGDNLITLAEKYGVSVRDIQKANSDRIKDVNIIRIGWELIIPTPSDESFQQLFQQAVEKVAELPEVKKLMRFL